jgi:hypothetical protein
MRYVPPREGGRVYCRSCWYNSQEILHKMRTMVREREARQRAEIAARKERDGLLDTGEAAKTLVTTEPALLHRARAGDISPAVVLFEKIALWRPDDLQSLVRKQARSSDPVQRQWLRDENAALSRWRGSGRVAKLARELGVPEREAEAILRDRHARRRQLILPHAAGRPPNTALHQGWDRLVREKRAELDREREERRALEIADSEPPSTDWDAACAVVEENPNPAPALATP